MSYLVENTTGITYAGDQCEIWCCTMILLCLHQENFSSLLVSSCVDLSRRRTGATWVSACWANEGIGLTAVGCSPTGRTRGCFPGTFHSSKEREPRESSTESGMDKHTPAFSCTRHALGDISPKKSRVLLCSTMMLFLLPMFTLPG